MDDLEKENTKKKEMITLLDPSRLQQQLQRRDEGYLPCSRTVNDPAAVLDTVLRMEHLWRRLREHAREVGRRQVLKKRMMYVSNELS